MMYHNTLYEGFWDWSACLYSGLPNESTGTHPKTWPKMQASTLIRVILQGSTLSKLCILVGQDLIGNPKMYIFSI